MSGIEERRRKESSPDAIRRREKELLEELDYLRQRERSDRLSRFDGHDRYYYDRYSEYSMRPPANDPYYDYPFTRPVPRSTRVDHYERLRREELEHSRGTHERFYPPATRPAFYDRPRDDPYEERRRYHRDPYADHYDIPPPRRY